MGEVKRNYHCIISHLARLQGLRLWLICGAAFGLRRSEAHSKHPHGNDDERAERDDGEGEEGV